LCRATHSTQAKPINADLSSFFHKRRKKIFSSDTYRNIPARAAHTPAGSAQTGPTWHAHASSSFLWIAALCRFWSSRNPWHQHKTSTTRRKAMPIFHGLAPPEIRCASLPAEAGKNRPPIGGHVENPLRRRAQGRPLSARRAACSGADRRERRRRPGCLPHRPTSLR
jgi:hypothetical protein